MLSQGHTDDKNGKAELKNEALRMLRSRRHFFVRTAAAGAATLALGGGVLAPVKSPVFAEDAAAALAGGVKGAPIYDLGIGKEYNRAPGKLVVLPPSVVEKSPADEKNYRYLTLPNGLRVMLVNDPKADTAAAALNVRVGHFSDPDNIPGLAHFCEHMLFLGTKKFPKEGELENYLTSNAGQSNAFTGDEETCYFFTVNANALKGALDRYSQFFVEPLFTESGVEREINAVNSENAKNLNTDSWRIGQLYKTRNNQAHPVAKFGTGNSETLAQLPKELGLNVREELLKFYKTYYSANQMTLAVSGREDLDTLQAWVTELFTEVPNSDRPPAESAYAGKISPIAPGAQDKALGIVPLEDARSLLITWSLPFTSKQDRENRRRSKPQNVLGAVVGYEGEGSLASYLKKQGLISSIFAGVVGDTSDLETFALAVEFTPDGFRRKDEVIAACFSYLDLIKREGVPEYVLKEVQQMSEVFFKYKEAEDASKVIKLAGNMHKYSDPRDWIAGQALMRDLKIESVTELLDKLRPEDAYLAYTNKEFASIADKKEKWYGTQYTELPVDRTRWTAKKLASLTLPKPNPFIPEDFSLQYALKAANKDGPSPPSVVVDSDTWRVFSKPDTTYAQPKGYAYFLINLPDTLLGSQTTPRTSALTKLYRACLDEALTEFTYDAGVAGLGYSCDFTQRGVSLSFSGFNDKLPAYIKSVAESIAAFVPDDEAKLAKFKDVIGRELAAFPFEQPYQHAGRFSQLVTVAPAYLPTDVLKELEALTLADLKSFTQSLWDKGYGQALIQGNIKTETARDIAKSVEAALRLKPLPEALRGAPRLAELPVAAKGYGSVLQREEPNPGDPNSAAVVQFQNADRDDVRQQMAMEVLAIIMGNPFFAELRTKQQLGYIVYGGVANKEGVRSLVFTAQSSVADADVLTEKIFAFMDEFSLENISDQQISAYISGLVSKKLEADKKLTTEVGRNWGEITVGQYRWKRRQEEAAAMKALKRKDLEEVLAQVVKQGGSRRRVLTTQVFSQMDVKGMAKLGKLAKEGTLIASTKDFQSRNKYFTPVKGIPA